MIRRPPRSTHCISSAASDVYKRQDYVFSLSDFKEIPEFTLSDSGFSSICTLKTNVHYSKRRKTKSESRNFVSVKQDSTQNLVADENPSGLLYFHKLSTTLSIKSNKHPLKLMMQRERSGEKDLHNLVACKDESCSSLCRGVRSGTSVESTGKKDSRKSCDSEGSLYNGRSCVGRRCSNR
eukprot:TRINITY_DN3227_c0_g1_i18.p1 TRINITY_DN3227_c0_g1~~TRINITY_DN3227_c0_g1_i18.p1  ORF type:complete len:188 (+),score=49.63 TRINITY_DN3227_c0_g1_i18:25-564(+)